MRPSTPSSTPLLLMEANAGIREALSTFLTLAAFRVTEATSDGEALAYLRQTPVPHVVLLQIFALPSVSRALLEAAAQDEALRRHCYVVVLASEMVRVSAEEERLLRTVCTEVVPFPADALDILAALADAATQLPASP